MREFFQELKRRNVYRVAATYAVVAFVVIQVADLVFPALNIPSWAYSLVVVLVLLGFPVALVLAWAFEMTPEGVRRTPDAATQPSPKQESGADSLSVQRASSGAAVGASSTASPGPDEIVRRKSRLAMQALVGLGLVGAAAVGGWYLTGSGGGTIDDRSVAVLPFDQLGQEEPGVFTEGMHSSLHTRLTNASGLKPISDQAVQRYRDSDRPTREIAEELGARWIVTGEVTESGERIRVSVHLNDPRTETTRWSESYARDLTLEGVFEIQADVASRVVRELEAELSPEEQARIERNPTGSREAYRLYVEGRSRLNTRTPAGILRGLDFLRRAVARDSSYALAWSGLADAVGLATSYLGADSVPTDLPDQETAARRAVELDPDLAEGYASLGLLHFNRREGPAALRRLRRAVELKPGYAQARHWLGYLLMVLGRREEAREHVEAAVELNPTHPSARAELFDLRLAQGRPEEARRQLRRVEQMHPRVDWVGYFGAASLARLEDWGELRRHLDTAVTQLPPRSGSASLAVSSFRALADLRTGEAQPSGDLIRRLEADGSYFRVALLHAASGDEDAAFEALRHVGPWNRNDVIALRYHYADVLGPLREDPRYGDILARIHRDWGLNPDGTVPDSVEASLVAVADE